MDTGMLVNFEISGNAITIQSKSSVSHNGLRRYIFILGNSSLLCWNSLPKSLGKLAVSETSLYLKKQFKLNRLFSAESDMRG
jgi:hypothetical protein